MQREGAEGVERLEVKEATAGKIVAFGKWLSGREKNTAEGQVTRAPSFYDSSDLGVMST